MTTLVRPVRVEDAEALRDIDLAVVRDGRGIVRVEADVQTDIGHWEDQIRVWTEGARSGDVGCMLVAERDGRVMGVSHIHRHTPSRVRHVAIVALQVHPEAQRMGLGRALMEGLLTWAKTGPGAGVVRVELWVREDNDRARALYESLGFRLESVRQRYLLDPDGVFRNDLTMVRFLDD